MTRPLIVACCCSLIVLMVFGCENQTQDQHEDEVVPTENDVRTEGKRDDPATVKPLPLADKVTTQNDLLTAIKRGDVAAVKRLVANGVNVNAGHEPLGAMSFTPLMVAASYNRKQIVRILLSAGTKLDSNSHTYGTPLHIAARHGRLENVKLLLAAGADVNAYSTDGYTVLTGAASQGHLDVVKLLVKKGAEVDAQRAVNGGRTGLTALIVAANWGRTEVVRFLLEQGADPNLTDSKGGHQTALICAAGRGPGFAEIVAFLLKHGAKHDIRNWKGMTALHRAVEGGTPEVEKLLTDAGATIDPLELEKLRLKRKQYEERIKREREQPRVAPKPDLEEKAVEGERTKKPLPRAV